MLTRVQTQNRVEVIAEQILQLLRDGKLRPGDKLPPESELMEQLGVGRSSVREAKRILAAKGVLTAQAGKGSFIQEVGSEILDGKLLRVLLSKQTIEDLQEVRDMLEKQVAILAAERATEADFQEIEDCLQKIERIAPASHVHLYTIEFHNLLARSTHNEVLVRMYEVIGDLLWNYLNPLYVQFADPEKELASHRRLFAAIHSRDVALAQAGMAEHLAEVWAFTGNLLQNSGEPESESLALIHK